MKKSETGVKKLEKTASAEDVAKKITDADIMSEQNKMLILRSAKNYVEPLKKEFKSTKEMFQYAKERCIAGLKENYEHSVIMDTKRNRIIAEFKGDAKSCSIKDIKKLNLDKDNTAVMHGHPKNYPLSYNDVCCLIENDINQMIAVDSCGEFSLVYKKQPVQSNKKGFQKWYSDRKENNRLKNALVCYSATSIDDYSMFKLANNEEWYKGVVDDTLKEYMPKLNLRYITNYGYLRKNAKQ